MSRKAVKVKEYDDDEHQLNILEAVENLSNIAEMDSEDKLGFIEDHLIVHESENDELESINWLNETSEHQTEKLVGDTYKTVLSYVKNFHEKELDRFYEKKNQDGLKKIMLLVGKATDKLSTFTHLFKDTHKEGVEGTQEFQQLEKFYKDRIAVEDKEDKISLIDLSRSEDRLDARKHPLQEEDINIKAAKQFVLDVEKVKEDKKYELLFIQREDGTAFFNRQNLSRNLKLACSFGEYKGSHLERDPIEGVRDWMDLSLYKSSKKILKLVDAHLKIFYSDAMKYKDMELVSQVNMALMALMMGANKKNRAHLAPVKSCGHYFYDFQHYIREALTSFEYHKLKSFPPSSSNVFLHTLMDILNLLTWSLYFQYLDVSSFGPVMEDIIEEGKATVRKKGVVYKKHSSLWENLEEDFVHIQRYLMNYPVGPLFLALKQTKTVDFDQFDNYLMRNLPSEWANFEMDSQNISMLRLPSPTVQEIISKVNLNQEFVGLLDALDHSLVEKKHLIINLQDRTHFTEFARSDYLEKMPRSAERVKSVNVITLSKTSDFYNQSGVYENLKSSEHFIKQFMFHLKSEETGYFFATWVQEKIFNGFAVDCMNQIHQFFFEGKTSLTQGEREDFIEIFYQFLTLKMLELSNPSSFSFTCKDALDAGAAASVGFYSFTKLISGESMNAKDQHLVYMMMFAHPLLIRNRAINSKDFLRTTHFLKRVTKAFKGESKEQIQTWIKKYFGKLFEEKTLKLKTTKHKLDDLTLED